MKILLLRGGFATMSLRTETVGSMVGEATKEPFPSPKLIGLILNITRRKVCANAEIDLKRSSGFFDKARRSTASSSLGIRVLRKPRASLAVA